MGEDQMMRKISQLEFQNDQLVAEMEYIDMLLRRVGFSEGLETVKWAAKDIVEEHYDGELDEKC